MSAAAVVDRAPPGAKHVTITQGMSGHFAVVVWWNPDMGGFWEPWDTGIGRYATPLEAYAEALALGEDNALPVIRQPELDALLLQIPDEEFDDEGDDDGPAF